MPAVPSNVAEAVCKRWPDRGPQWLNNVHDELSALCERYGAKPVQAMRARYGFVVDVRTSSGRLVFRSSPDPNGFNQAQVSLALADLGVAPKVHELSTTATGVWTVADRLIPGTPMGDLRDQIESAALAAMLEPIAGRPAPASDMPSLTDWLRDRLTDPQPNDLPVGRNPAPTAERRRAQDVLEDLAGDHVAGLCHGDASPQNVLLGEHRRLWLIEPRGMAGDVAFDVAVIALKAAKYMAPTSGATLLATHAGIDPERAREWVIVADAARV